MDSKDIAGSAGQELDSHDWFAALDTHHQALLRAGSTLKHFPAGAFITRRGEPSLHWVGVHTGLIKLAVYNADGRAATFSGVPAGGWCGGKAGVSKPRFPKGAATAGTTAAVAPAEAAAPDPNLRKLAQALLARPSFSGLY